MHTRTRKGAHENTQARVHAHTHLHTHIHTRNLENAYFQACQPRLSCQVQLKYLRGNPRLEVPWTGFTSSGSGCVKLWGLSWHFVP